MNGAERNSVLGNYSFTPYAAGKKTYNQVGSSPTQGPVDATGYAERDRILKAKRNAILGKMKAMNAGAYANQNALRFTK